MSVRWLDDFGFYATADTVIFYPLWQDFNATVTIDSTVGRYENGSLKFVVSAFNGCAAWRGRTFDAQAAWTVGFNFRYTAVSGANRIHILRILDGLNGQVELGINGAGQLFVSRNATIPTGGGPSAVTLSPNTWYALEMKCTIANSIAANSWQVMLDGTVVLTVATGQSSNATGSGTADRVRIGPEQVSTGSGSGTLWYDDFYVLDGQAGLTGFRLTWKCTHIFPSGAGANTTWSRDGSSTSNWDAVNNPAIAGDTTYVQTGTVGNVDTYAFADLDAAITNVLAAVEMVYARQTDAGPRTLADVCKSGATTSAGTAQTLTGSFAVYAFPRETDPATGSAWTVSGFNAAEFGVKVVA